MKKRDMKKLGLQAERIRELTIGQLPAVIGGLMNDGAGGGGGTESQKCPPTK